ncbi:MAG TPA: DoxX family protein [Candidatus Acidoferrum sp.]|nr:DoxX family protein [Candidatus Acidoferrum sp.]
MKALNLLFKIDNNVSTLLLRLLLGVVFFPHGAQMALGWFGGYGFSGTMGFFTETLHIPAPFAFLAIAAQFAGAIALILGLFTRVAALGIAVNMLVAVAMVHAQYGWFMNWFGNQKGEGFEYHLLAIGIAIVLMIRGGGKWAADTVIENWLGAPVSSRASV